jgi:hypothetical protein
LLLLRTPLAGLVGRDSLEDVDVERGEGLSSERLENRFKKRETAEGPDGPDVAPVTDNFVLTAEFIAAAAASLKVSGVIVLVIRLESPVTHDWIENRDVVGERSGVVSQVSD